MKLGDKVYRMSFGQVVGWGTITALTNRFVDVAMKDGRNFYRIPRAQFNARSGARFLSETRHAAELQAATEKFRKMIGEKKFMPGF